MPEQNFLSVKTLLGATTIAVAEAGVWTQVSYLPHWLLTLTTLLAIGSFLVLTLETTIRSLSLNLAKLFWTVHIGFILSVLYAFLGNVGPAPFSANILASIVYVGRGPVSLFMVAYDSREGLTASPATYLMYIELVNRDDHPIRIESYSVSVSRHRYIPWWYKLPPIPLSELPIFSVAPKNISLKPKSRGEFWFSSGTLLLAEHPEAKGELSHCFRMAFSPLFDEEIRKPIGAHETVQGWAAFDRAGDIRGLKHKYLELAIRDSTNTVSKSIVEMPLPVPNEVDTTHASMERTNVEIDLSHCYLKFYAMP